MATTSYVKFLRGSIKAYQAKVDTGTVDENTLYFIYENKDSTTGQLYLGTKLLTNGTSSSSSSSDFGNVIISEVGDKQILVYDATDGTWKNASIYDIVDVMLGASQSEDGASGLVPAPSSSDYKKFLRGDGTWSDDLDIPLDEKTLKFIDGKLTVIGGTATNVDFISTPTEDDVNKVLKGDGTWQDEYITSVDESKFEVTDGKLSYTEGSFNDIVTAPTEDDVNKVLKGDGTWQDEYITSVDESKFEVTDGKLSYTEGSFNDIVTAPTEDDVNKVLKGDGTWQDEYITSVDEDIFSVENGELKLNDSVDMLTEEDRQKLDSMTIDEDGNLVISATYSATMVVTKKISAENITDLDTYLEEHGYSKTGFSSDEIEKLNTLDKEINGETDSSGTVVSDGLMVRVEALEKIVNGYTVKSESGDDIAVKGTQEQINEITSSVGDLNQLVDTRTDEQKAQDGDTNISIVEAINNITNSQQWEDF